tara:strand:- start:973 stop:1266 length:294 start_codon:yes stop_codon:yes gene_type:complete
MSIGSVGAVTTGIVPRTPVAASAGQQGQTPQQLGTPQHHHQGGMCCGHHPEPLKSMSTETFMALKNQPTGPEAAMDGMKKVLEMVALMKILEAIQEM